MRTTIAQQRRSAAVSVARRVTPQTTACATALGLVTALMGVWFGLVSAWPGLL
jgi:hypothetical protein